MDRKAQAEAEAEAVTGVSLDSPMILPENSIEFPVLRDAIFPIIPAPRVETLSFIHIFWVSDHDLGRGATS